MKQNPKVSIIIPVYNGSNYLKEAIESALSQTYKNTEIIVINDGSRDNGATENIALSFGKKIRYFRKSNGGVASALNFGIIKMTGDYFSWLSHDDLYLPKKLQKQVNLILKSPSKTLIYSNFAVIDGMGDNIKTQKFKSLSPTLFLQLLIKKRFLQGCTLLIPKSVFDDVGVFNEKLRNTQDYDLWFRLIEKGYLFRLCSDILVLGRQHGNQTSILTADVQRIEEEKLFIQVLDRFKAEQLFLPNENICMGYLKLALSFQILGLFKSANYAYSLSRKNLALKNYITWFLGTVYFLIWRHLLFQIFGFAVQIKRRIRRSGQFLQSSKQKSPIFCLIGNITSGHNQKLIDFLKKNGYEVHFISIRKGKISGVKCYDLSRKTFEPSFLWYLRAIFSTRKIVKKIQPTILQGQYLNSGGILAYYSNFRPYIIGIFGSDVLEAQPFYAKYLVKSVLKNADLIVGSSFVLKEGAISLGAEPTKIHLIRFGIDFDIFKPNKTQNLRHKLGLKDEKIIFSPRMIQSIYNIDILVKSFVNISNKGNFKLALINQPIDYSYLNKIKKIIKEYNLESKVIFLPPVENFKMVDYYNLAEVIVSIPRSDSAAVSFLEAMACQKKIVVSKLPFLKEWRHGQNFWETEIDVNSLSRTLLLALNEPKNKFRSIGQSNRRLVQKEANIETCFDRLDDLYREFI